MTQNANDQAINQFPIHFERIRSEIAKVIVGNADIIEGSLICLLCGGHALLEGVPGLGKTLLVRSLAEAMDLQFSRIQFTPDLMPADITGTNILIENAAGQKAFQFQAGPIFSQILLADEINRATPKTQSATLEAMQEHSVTVAGTHYILEEPFFVMATQNPIEMEGTYPLPEAQMDRFFYKLAVPSPSFADLTEIVDRTTRRDIVTVEKVIDRETILWMRDIARDVPIASHVRDFAVKLVLATQPNSEYAHKMTNLYVRSGSSPRGAQALILSAKVRALLDGRYNVAYDDIAASALPALRHRIILNFEADADEITTDTIIKEITSEQLQESVRVSSR